MKKWIVMFMFGGMFSTVGLVNTTSAEDAASVQPVGTAGSDADPCPSCCPPHLCGMNGPSFDGTTESVAHPAR
jgi:hypothetical protein